ncbi:MAG: STAS domain-containing protein [Eubacterium sp.]|nr:STAS domain-containing protein [Eubacterium sp.]
MSLEIRKKPEGSKLVVELEGRLDTITAQQLEKELRTAVDGVTELVFEMTGLTYITSAGLRVISAAMKVMKKQGHMVLRNMSPDVREVFDVTGLSNIMNIE